MAGQGMYPQCDIKGQVGLFDRWEPPVGPHNDFGLDFTPNNAIRAGVNQGIDPQENQHAESADLDVAFGDLDDEDNKPQESYLENAYSSIMASRGYYDYGSST